MRKLILYLAASLDGYIARPDGALDWLPTPQGDDGDDLGYGELMQRVDTVLYGRKTYEFMRAHGETAMPGLRNILFSRSYAEALPPEVVRVAQPLHKVVERLRAEPGNDIWLAGGGGLIREALEADLLDEIQLATMPVLLGEGIPLWVGGHPERHFAVTQARITAGMVFTRYERVQPS